MRLPFPPLLHRLRGHPGRSRTLLRPRQPLPAVSRTDSPARRCRDCGERGSQTPPEAARPGWELRRRAGRSSEVGIASTCLCCALGAPAAPPAVGGQGPRGPSAESTVAAHAVSPRRRCAAGCCSSAAGSACLLWSRPSEVFARDVVWFVTSLPSGAPRSQVLRRLRLVRVLSLYSSYPRPCGECPLTCSLLKTLFTF